MRDSGTSHLTVFHRSFRALLPDFPLKWRIAANILQASGSIRIPTGLLCRLTFKSNIAGAGLPRLTGGLLGLCRVASYLHHWLLQHVGTPQRALGDKRSSI
jgi:hypothetical protein